MPPRDGAAAFTQLLSRLRELLSVYCPFASPAGHLCPQSAAAPQPLFPRSYQECSPRMFDNEMIRHVPTLQCSSRDLQNFLRITTSAQLHGSGVGSCCLTVGPGSDVIALPCMLSGVTRAIRLSRLSARKTLDDVFDIAGCDLFFHRKCEAVKSVVRSSGMPSARTVDTGKKRSANAVAIPP